ncbi:hypothetical protein MWU60_11590 [Yoonia sp. F2084L]|uniref:hypothetical protein n=1 Tax=Yoonia sp. F2084L TaxID=2926419 RepID=UPI001FF36E6A|nr:hypothetical protein [Yoonia sp. F2084L]MCK0096216.1 hypothetical protein [Yoonia sp. F2084L]
MTSKASAIAKTACFALALTFTAATVFTTSAAPAFAERGGNGNGNGNGNKNGNGNSGDRGNSRANNAERGSAGNNGRGHLARELRGLNAAHANPNALANASPNSMPGKLSVFKQAQEEFADVVAVQDDAYAEYQRLTELTEDEIAAEFPEGGYDDAVTTAAQEYTVARENAVQAQITAEESLSELTGGRELSDGTLAELWRLLDL